MRPNLALFVLAVLAAPNLAHAAKPPVVFETGFGATGDFYADFSPLKGFLAGRGYRLLVARSELTGTIEERAARLNAEIQRLVPEGRFLLIGHSKGGLDARLAIHEYGLGDRVIALTTLATPNHGSAVADYVVAHLGENLAGTVLKTLFGGDLDGVRDMTTAYVDGVFNPSVPDDPRVRTFSMGFTAPRPVALHVLAPWLWPGAQILDDAGQPDNDCLVSVESARWGTYLGTMTSDHIAETSQVPSLGGVNYRQVFGRVFDELEARGVSLQ